MKKFRLLRYVLPSVISMVLVGTYTNIDGLFIGNRAGDDGLAAINVAWPIVALITSLGTAIGVGAAVEINKNRGEGNARLAARQKDTALFLLLAAGIAATGLCLFLYTPLLRLLGATGTVLTYAGDYAYLISLGALFQVVGAGMVVLLRSDGSPFLSAAYTAVGLALHVVLDVALVGRFALSGVAAATVLSQAAVAGLGLFSFFRHRKADREETGSDARHPPCPAEEARFPGVRNILRNALPPLGLNFAPSMTLVFTNWFALRLGGVAAVGAYAVMSYVLYTYDYVFQGVCDGTQPLLSYDGGAGNTASVKKTVRASIWLLAGLSAVFMALTPAAIAFLPGVFAVSPAAERMMQTGFLWYALAYPLKAAVKFSCSYCYSTGRERAANGIAYADPLLFTPLLLLLSMETGIEGVWAALPLAQAATCLLALALTRKGRRRAAS